MKMKEKSKKAGLELNIQKTKITASNPITSWPIDGKKKKNGNSDRLQEIMKDREGWRVAIHRGCEESDTA